MSTAGPIRPTHHHTTAHGHRSSGPTSGSDAFASMLDKQGGTEKPSGVDKPSGVEKSSAAERAGTAMSQVHATATPGASAASAAAACHSAGVGRYVGHSTGSGQCVALVHATHPDLGPTSNWVRGEAVKGNTSLAPGTPIATFSRSGHYANATDGSSHAAIYLGQTAHGVQVLDQWAGRAAAVRTIPWSHPGGTAANTGAAFHVVRAGNLIA
jgi:hypothetical protein